MKRLSKVSTAWSPALAYAVGLITSDGNLSKDGRHMNLTSKDEVMIITFKKCLGLQNKIGKKTRSKSRDKKYFQIQFGDKNFYEFLLSIGLMPAKSKVLGPLSIPKKYFADFLRGCIDGDGNIDIQTHPESSHPQLRIRLFSASLRFLEWTQQEIEKCVAVGGGWIESYPSIHRLSYGKNDSIKLFEFIYYSGAEWYLERKWNLAKNFLRV